jgi:redox-sensitive bicupin YhaK (pirin superfamily)
MARASGCSLGQRQNARLDPFLMLDEFGSFDANDYIAGFPPHPHRGFETVTYMLEGHMLHEDHMGNKGHLRSGDVQWMTAAHGIIHSEMPQQQEGRMHGFQLFLFRFQLGVLFFKLIIHQQLGLLPAGLDAENGIIQDVVLFQVLECL